MSSRPSNSSILGCLASSSCLIGVRPVRALVNAISSSSEESEFSELCIGVDCRSSMRLAISISMILD